MNTAGQTIECLIDKIQHLPVDRITEVEDFVDFLSEKIQRQKLAKNSIKQFDFPTVSVGQWPQDLSLQREDMYGDDGR